MVQFGQIAGWLFGVYYLFIYLFQSADDDWVTCLHKVKPGVCLF